MALAKESPIGKCSASQFSAIQLECKLCSPPISLFLFQKPCWCWPSGNPEKSPTHCGIDYSWVSEMTSDRLKIDETFHQTPSFTKMYRENFYWWTELNCSLGSTQNQVQWVSLIYSNLVVYCFGINERVSTNNYFPCWSNLWGQFWWPLLGRTKKCCSKFIEHYLC